jgi:hypothetical protein
LGLVEVLAEDISVLWSDGGGKALAALRPIYGVQAITRLWIGLARKVPPTSLLLLSRSMKHMKSFSGWAGR